MKGLCIWVSSIEHFVLAFDNAGETTYYHRPIKATPRIGKLAERFYDNSSYKVRPFRGECFGLVIEKVTP